MYTKKEAGLYPSYAEFEWYNFSSEDQVQINRTLSKMKSQFKQQKGQRVWSEHYTYDNNSNRLTKTTITNTISVDDLSNKIYEAMAPQRIVANAGKQEQTVNKDKYK